MNSLQRALSRMTLNPSIESERCQSPEANEDDFVEFRDGDVDNPRNWSLARKRYITSITLLQFDISSVAAQLATSLFLLGFCAGPLWMLYATFFLYFCFTCLTAWPPNLGGPFAIGPGVLVDILDKGECGNAMGILICICWIGSALGTVISGCFELKKDWRWSMYACLWLGSFTMIPMLTIPETHSPTVLAQKAKLTRHQGHDIEAAGEASRPKLLQLYKIALARPWVLLFDTISLLCCLYSCLIDALQYMLFSIYPIVFQELRGWNTAVSQLPVLGQAVGAMFGLLIVFDHTRRRKAKADMWREMLPEDLMVLAMVGGVGFLISMLWLCWSAQYNSVHWIVPTAGGTVLAICLMLIHVSCFSYITDTYADYAASVIAANIVARCISSAGAPLFTRQTFNAIVVGGGGSLIAGVAALLPKYALA
ncbi:major facilitator superfamily domain-containing protein [Fusarium redolens]|uniref:Major facilitator superfamily domain-containing protein n=1 Tax=Fusarium redolens TaxID=48865 RepID=A0A9P9FWI1_FUSRE|nr:major facilitator superfamily domain-containing protein [Fusarium redolens]KAH7207920.1 major facilitator superfamily domain-containing protein [Fusarium redolens]